MQKRKFFYLIKCLRLKSGAPRRTRTADLLFTKQLLYQLSYWGRAVDRLNAMRTPCKTESPSIMVVFSRLPGCLNGRSAMCRNGCVCGRPVLRWRAGRGTRQPCSCIRN
jgi:hypothetical protein